MLNEAAALLTLASAGISAKAQKTMGKSQMLSAELDAFNLETDKKLSHIEARQSHNDRMEIYRRNLSSNIAVLYAQGRDVNRDGSAQAFLAAEKSVVGDDLSRLDFMKMFEAMKIQQQATTVRVEGRARYAAAKIGAYTTIMQGFANAASTAAGGGGTGSGLTYSGNKSLISSTNTKSSFDYSNFVGSRDLKTNIGMDSKGGRFNYNG
jgi:hypothetical protein